MSAAIVNEVVKQVANAATLAARVDAYNKTLKNVGG